MSIFESSNIAEKLNKSSERISTGLLGMFNGKKIDDNLLSELEDLLITSDLGIEITNEILKEISKNKYNKTTTAEDIKFILAKYIKDFLLNSEKKIIINSERRPYIIMFVGINGVGKTTVIGKITKKLKNERKNVLLAACDTFRAGAVEQLGKWADTCKVDLVKAKNEGTEPSTVAYMALEKAKRENYDVLLIDTAGRMQNDINLMAELQKVERVIKKLDYNGIDERILVLDATIGQNAKSQVELFNKSINISGLIMNKMDGTAKGGILVPIFHKFKKPIYAIGVGENVEDLQEFNIDNYVISLLNLKNSL
jgi:fused signal recognition particle receptor